LQASRDTFGCVRVTSPVLRLIVVLILVPVIGLGLLYAYRAQAAATPTVSETVAVGEIQADRVDEIVVENDRAMLILVDGTREQTETGGIDAVLSAATEHNRVKPARGINVRYVYRWPFGLSPLSVFLSLVPLLFFCALIATAGYVLLRGRRASRYARVERLAILRDRGVITEDEFERENG
jgi:uncharacterized membrane protein